MTITFRNILIEKSTNKKNGIYSLRGFLYVVHDNRFVAFADLMGNCYQCFNSFNLSIGKVQVWERKSALKKWINQNK